MSTGRHNAQGLPQRLLAAARTHLLDLATDSHMNEYERNVGALLAHGRRAGGPADA